MNEAESISVACIAKAERERGRKEGTEQMDSLVYDLLFLANKKADDIISGNEIIALLLKNKIDIIQKKDFVWELVGGNHE